MISRGSVHSGQTALIAVLLVGAFHIDGKL